MIEKHSRDVIFIVIILILVGIIWGVEKHFWILISVNVLIIMIGLLYVNYANIEFEVKKESKNNNYDKLRNMAELEMDEFLNEVDYDDFESVKKGKEILNKFYVGENIDSVVNKIKKHCNYDIEMYYLGITAICMANTYKLKEQDYDYISIGIKLINSSKKMETKLTNFLKKVKI